jgi:hypothetical protein
MILSILTYLKYWELTELKRTRVVIDGWMDRGKKGTEAPFSLTLQAVPRHMDLFQLCLGA